MWLIIGLFIALALSRTGQRRPENTIGAIVFWVVLFFLLKGGG